MASVFWKSANKHIQLRIRSLIGRHPECQVHVATPKVSGEHASVHWTNGAWELRDLGSRNGTFIDGRRLDAGERVVLVPGMTISLSRSAAVFEVMDVSAPMAVATHLETGEVHIADKGMLALPSEQSPRATLFANSSDVWHIEMDSLVRRAVHQETIWLGNDSYVLEIPEPFGATVASGAHAAPVESISMRFAVTPDEEQVDLIVIVDGQTKRLEPRGYHYMLVTLARARLADANAPLSVRGWLDRDELCKKLGMDLSKLNVEIHRARKQFATLGVHGAASLVERRPVTHEIRLGIANVEVMTLT